TSPSNGVASLNPNNSRPGRTPWGSGFCVSAPQRRVRSLSPLLGDVPFGGSNFPACPCVERNTLGNSHDALSEAMRPCAVYCLLSVSSRFRACARRATVKGWSTDSRRWRFVDIRQHRWISQCEGLFLCHNGHGIDRLGNSH